MARILAVDDDPLIRRAIERILRRAGHEILQASHGDEALRLAEDRSFDVALVDYQLPTLDGLEVLQRLRELQPACLRVLVTGQLDLPLIMEAVNRGEVTRVVEKPFESQRLIQAVEESLSARRRMVEVARVQERAASEQERAMLADVLQGDHVRLALQPIIATQGRKIVAVEALLRSTHPVLDGPLPVLRAAERHNMLHKVAQVVVEQAVDAMESRIPEGVMLFMNLHPDELADPEGLSSRLEPLTPYAGRVVLEITERSKLQGIDSWERSVDRVTEQGFAIAVDDLGAGYSSLSVLAELQPRYIKIDMSIVRGVDEDARKQRLVDLLCRFADATEAEIIAEGVETEPEAEALSGCGAHMLQGYLFGRPSLDPIFPEKVAS
jgi:EAL domain-containing protein (putative c-di-GMP-specific phosphodiesterase class I)/CheY-like chemotaxis protein